MKYQIELLVFRANNELHIGLNESVSVTWNRETQSWDIVSDDDWRFHAKEDVHTLGILAYLAARLGHPDMQFIARAELERLRELVSAQPENA